MCSATWDMLQTRIGKTFDNINHAPVTVCYMKKAFGLPESFFRLSISAVSYCLTEGGIQDHHHRKAHGGADCADIAVFVGLGLGD